MKHYQTHSEDPCLPKENTDMDEEMLPKLTNPSKKQYKSDQCDKAFTSSGNLTMHKRAHTGEKPFMCDQCDKTFSRSRVLTQHKTIHTEEQPFKCESLD